MRERGSGFFTVYAVLVAVFGFVAWVRGSSDARIIGDVLGFLLLVGPVFAILRMQRGILAKSMLFCLPRISRVVACPDLLRGDSVWGGMVFIFLEPFPAWDLRGDGSEFGRGLSDGDRVLSGRDDATADSVSSGFRRIPPGGDSSSPRRLRGGLGRPRRPFCGLAHPDAGAGRALRLRLDSPGQHGVRPTWPADHP